MRASIRSTETAPTPSQNGWYGEANGTTAAAMPMLTNGSAMAVPMCWPARTRP
ncbi:MAG TPA: hypothetical protein VFX25_09535 [Streptosporangiaceae bacterium]|nr:hypothetical protein [Streptosporangiaceae bacterium]